MYKVDSVEITKAVTDIFTDICINIDSEVLCLLNKTTPSNSLESFALSTMVENANIARSTNSPACQDTGLAIVFIEVGQQVVITGDYLEDAINEGVREAYKPFRKSILTPLTRINTLDNTPAVIHTKIVKGNNIKISGMAKGFGSENMSKLYMLTPADGVDGVIEKVVETVKLAGSCPCPPIIVGVGIGGDMEKASIMSKHALLRPITSNNDDASIDKLEKLILQKINNLNIGAQGFGGKSTALAVLIEKAPTHIAGLPLAVSIQCHCSRHKEVILEGKYD